MCLICTVEENVLLLIQVGSHAICVFKTLQKKCVIHCIPIQGKYILRMLSTAVIFSLQLEVRLANKEEKLLEKALIYEEVNRLSERTKKKADTGKEDTLNLAKKV